MEKFDTYKSQIKDGEHTHWSHRGEKTSIGNYNDGKEDGRWVTYDEYREILYVNYYKNGNPCKIISSKQFSNDEERDHHHFSDDELEEIELDENILDGEIVEHLENGDVSSVLNYKQGRLHGRCVSYYDGIPGIGYELVFCEGEYKDGKRHGEFTWVNKDGTIKEIKIYKDGGIIKEISNVSELRNENNKQKIYLGWGKYEIGSIRYGKKIGKWTRFYYETGKIIGYANYIDGKCDGDFMTFHENGYTFREGKHKGDQEDGIIKIYNEDGTLQKEEIYEGGKLIEN